MSRSSKWFVLAGTALSVLAAFCVLSGCSNKAQKNAAIEKYGADTMKLYLPGAYMSDSLIPDFEKQFGVKVIVEYFDSNEMMYAKVQAGDKYDVLIPSDYMIERLLKQKMLQPIDKAAITNMDQLSKNVLNASYDPDNTYSIPYFWGTVGIVYNKTKVDENDLKTQGYGIFHNTKYAGRVYWYDSERDSFMAALKNLGFSMNTENKDEINKAYDWLLKMNDTMQPAYVTDEVIDSMTNGLKDLAIVYSGDAATILNENKDMSYFTPNEGTNIWYDAMVIPANAAAPKLANAFINYTIDYEVARANAEAVGYASPNEKVLNDLSAKGAMFEGNDAYLPRAGYEKDEVFHDNDTIRAMISELWIKVKAH